MSTDLKPHACGKCGKVWNPAVDSLLQLFNHAEIHFWIESEFKRKCSWMVRSGWTKEQQLQYVQEFITRELTEQRQLAAYALTLVGSNDSLAT